MPFVIAATLTSFCFVFFLVVAWRQRRRFPARLFPMRVAALVAGTPLLFLGWYVCFAVVLTGTVATFSTPAVFVGSLSVALLFVFGLLVTVEKERLHRQPQGSRSSEG